MSLDTGSQNTRYSSKACIERNAARAKRRAQYNRAPSVGFGGGAGSIPGSVIGAFMMACLANGSGIKDLPNFMQEIIIGVVIILAVGMDKIEPMLQRILRRGK